MAAVQHVLEALARIPQQYRSDDFTFEPAVPEPDPPPPGPDVPTDGPGGAIFVPANATDFTELGQAAPQSLWLSQELAGNPADSIGALSLSALNTPGYGAAVAGWTRLGLTTANGGIQRFVLPSGTGPSPAATSQLWGAYIDFTAAPAATRVFFGLQGTTSCDARLLTTGRLRFSVNGVTVDGSVDHLGDGVHPIFLLFDRTNARAVLYSDQEKIVGTFAAGVNDGNKGLGSGAGAACSMVWACMYSGAPAEKSDAQVKSLLTALGWSIPWT
jgi:hypothetical protein